MHVLIAYSDDLNPLQISLQMFGAHYRCGGILQEMSCCLWYTVNVDEFMEICMQVLF